MGGWVESCLWTVGVCIWVWLGPASGGGLWPACRLLKPASGVWGLLCSVWGLHFGFGMCLELLGPSCSAGGLRLGLFCSILVACL